MSGREPPIVVVMPLGDRAGGAEMLLWSLLKHGRTKGVRWVVVFLRDGQLRREVKSLGIAAPLVEAGRFRQPHRWVRAAWVVAELVRRERAVAVLGWMAAGQPVAGLAAARARVPSVWFQWGTPGGHWLDRLATLIPARGVLACSASSARAQAALRPRRVVRVVHPGVDLQEFDPARLPAPSVLRQRLGIQGDPVIGIVGRLQSWKGMHVLVRAMPQLLRHYPRLQCAIVGGTHSLEPQYPARLRALIADLGLGNAVLLPGPQPNVAEWMQAMDVVVHASDNEPFGLVVIEAMALGKPVIAGASGGPADIITDGSDGLLSPYGDSEALAERVLRCLGDDELGRRLAAASRHRAQDFSVERYVDALLAAIRTLVPEVQWPTQGQRSPAVASEGGGNRR